MRLAIRRQLDERLQFWLALRELEQLACRLQREHWGAWARVTASGDYSASAKAMQVDHIGGQPGRPASANTLRGSR